MNNRLTPEDEKIVRRIRIAVRVVLWTITLGFFGFAAFLFWAFQHGLVK
jgi:hypothetical protein